MNAIEKALAAAAKDAVTVATFVEQKILPALEKVDATAATVEAVTGLVNQQAGAIATAAYSLLGVVIKAIQDAPAAVTASGLNVSLDATVVADVKAIAPAVLALVAKV